MKEIINSLLILISTLFLKNKRKRNVSSEDVLVLFGGVIGDAVLFYDCIETIILHFKEEKRSIKVLVKPAVYELYNHIASDIECFESFDLNRYVTDYNYYHMSNKIFEHVIFEKCIVPLPSVSVDMLTMNIIAKEKSTYDDNTIEKSRLIYKVIRRKAYNSTIRLDYSRKLIDKVWDYTNAVCGEYNPTKIINFRVEKHTEQKEYVMIFPICSTSERNWDQEKFKEVIDYVVERGYLTIVSCPNKEKKLINYLADTYNRATDVIFETALDIKALLAYIQGARLIIACDSAPNHLASAMGVANICILSGRDDGQLMPYSNEKNITGHDPICVGCSHMDCFGCNLGRGKLGRNNPMCRLRIILGLSSVCVENVSAADVKRAIKELLSKQENR